MKRIAFSLALILLVNWASSNPVGPVKARQLAETFWQQSGCAVRSGIAANALADITLACTTPPTAGEDTFNSYTATIHVPAGTADSYRQQEIWGRFTNIVEGTATGIEDHDLNGINIYARNGRIVVEGTDSASVQVFDMKGQPVPAAESLQAGIYLVKVGNRLTRKVTVTK